MSASITSVLSAFNSEAGKAIKHTAGQSMAVLADSKSAYGRAVRDVTAVALSGRWRDDNGAVMSDNAIGHILGVAMRQPRARLSALTGSGLVFRTDKDIRDNADVWAHVAKMYNAGTDGRKAVKDAAETIKSVSDVTDKRAAWLATPVPARVENKGSAKPPTGDKDKGADKDALSEVDADKGNLPTDTTERIKVSEAETSTLLAYMASIGTELAKRNKDMTVAERATFREVAASLSATVKATAKK